MKLRLLVLLAMLGAVTAAVLPGSAAYAGRSVAGKPATIARDSVPARTTAAFSPEFSQGIGLYVFSDIYGTDCAVFTGSSSNWGNCRNQDEGLDNDTNVIVRIYYSPDYKGAWTCLPAWEYYSNLNHSNETFNSGQGKAGYGQQVWENVASSGFGTGTCSNPMPGGKAYPPG